MDDVALQGGLATQIFNEPMENARAEIISIFEKERRVEDTDGQLKKKPTEYEELIMELWDYCDTQTIATIESVIVEFEGQLLGEYNPKVKSYATQLEDYLKARIETGEREQ